MAFFRWRTIKGHSYLYREERWREDGKVRSRSTIVRDGRKEALEKYRNVLRDNVYRYGKSHPGERYQREAKAREQYHRFLDLEKLPTIADQYNRLMERGRAVAEERPTPPLVVKAEVPAPSYPPKGTPTDEEETARADALLDVHDWSGQRQAEYEESAPDVEAPSAGQATSS